MRNIKPLLTSLLLLLTLAGAATAALPPLSPEDQQRLASNIVEASVIKVEKSTIEVPQGTDTLYTMQLHLGKVKKGELQSGQTITASCQKTGQRPAMMVGPQGQNSIPKEGTKGTFYLTGSPQSGFKLLQPNGWTEQ